MPSKAICNRIKDPVKRERCLKYQGEFSQPEKDISRKSLKKIKTGGY